MTFQSDLALLRFAEWAVHDFASIYGFSHALSQVNSKNWGSIYMTLDTYMQKVM